MKPIRIGTRGSKLALYQANQVADLLNSAGLEYEIVIIDTKGDKILDVAISKIGSKGVFTEELESQLEDGKIDIAVHSAKDLPSILPEGFDIIAFTAREKVNDVIISHKREWIDIKDPSKNLVLGTSATRRVATLLHHYPHIQTVEIRGNLQTRISKMENGACDGLILAYAGVHRMGYEHLVKNELSLEEFIPAVGQGTIGVEAHVNLEKEIKNKIKAAVNSPETDQCLQAERGFLKVLEGGCSIPAFALAQIKDQKLFLKGGLISLDGKEKLYHEVSGSPELATSLGKELAKNILSQGGDQILFDIKHKLN
ncbi:MAG: hydroxymethylbilane synthase [Cyclobacteriaceae bacterium]